MQVPPGKVRGRRGSGAAVGGTGGGGGSAWGAAPAVSRQQLKEPQQGKKSKQNILRRTRGDDGHVGGKDGEEGDQQHKQVPAQRVQQPAGRLRAGAQHAAGCVCWGALSAAALWPAHIAGTPLPTQPPQEEAHLLPRQRQQAQAPTRRDGAAQALGRRRRCCRRRRVANHAVPIDRLSVVAGAVVLPVHAAGRREADGAQGVGSGGRAGWRRRSGTTQTSGACAGRAPVLKPTCTCNACQVQLGMAAAQQGWRFCQHAAGAWLPAARPPTAPHLVRSLAVARLRKLSLPPCSGLSAALPGSSGEVGPACTCTCTAPGEPLPRSGPGVAIAPAADL